MKEKIYLLPGLMCNEKLWVKLEPLLCAYELIYLSIPLKKDVDEMCEELNTVLPNEPVNLLGFSLGGYLASYFALQYPNKVQRLFIMACSPCSMSENEINKRKEVLQWIEKYGFKGLGRQKVVSLLDKANQHNHEIIATIQQMYVELGKEVFVGQINSTLYRKDIFESLLKLNKPIKFYYAQHDRLVNTNWLSNFSKHDAKSVEMIENSTSHMLPLEYPNKVAQAVHQWLKKD